MVSRGLETEPICTETDETDGDAGDVLFVACCVLNGWDGMGGIGEDRGNLEK